MAMMMDSKRNVMTDQLPVNCFQDEISLFVNASKIMKSIS